MTPAEMKAQGQRCSCAGSDELCPCQNVRSGEPFESLHEQVVRLTRERDEWKERWEAERRDHEATIKHCDDVMSDDRDYQYR